MRRHFRWDKKYLYWGVTAFCVIAAAIVFYMALNYLPGMTKALGKLLGIFSPFIWGLVLAYLLTPLMRWLDRAVFQPLFRRLFRGSKMVDYYRTRLTPAIIQIPGISNNTGAGILGVKDSVKQAVGSDILFGDE